eukprot:scaffold8455_cov325-Pinguiococcus_pyrenoidosus.AAC.3
MRSSFWKSALLALMRAVTRRSGHRRRCASASEGPGIRPLKAELQNQVVHGRRAVQRLSPGACRVLRVLGLHTPRLSIPSPSNAVHVLKEHTTDTRPFSSWESSLG